MAVYELTRKDGAKIKVRGPEGATKEQLIDIYNREINRDIMREREDAMTRAARDRYTALASEAAREREPGVLDYLGEVPKGLIGGAAGLVESGLLGAATILPEEAEKVVREGVKSAGDAVQSFVQPDFNAEESIPRKFSEAAGSFAGLVGIAALNPYAAGAVAVGAGAGEASERARAAGATEEERAKASALGAVVGASELISPLRIVRAFGKGPTQEVQSRILRALREGGVEGAQESAAGIAQNMIEQGYNPEQGTFTGTGEAGAYGFGVGALAQTLLDLALPRSRGGSGTDGGLTENQKEELLALPPPTEPTIDVTPEGEAIIRGSEAAQERDAVLGDMPSLGVREAQNLNRAVQELRAGDITFQEFLGRTEGIPIEIIENLNLFPTTRDRADLRPREGIAGLLPPPSQAIEVTPEGEAATPEQRTTRLAEQDAQEAELQRLIREEEPVSGDMPPLEVRQSRERAEAAAIQEQQDRARAEQEAADDAELARMQAEEDAQAAEQAAQAEAQATQERVTAAVEQPFRQAAERRQAVIDEVLAASETGSLVRTEKAVQRALQEAGMPRTQLSRREKNAVRERVAQVKAARPAEPTPQTAPRAEEEIDTVSRSLSPMATQNEEMEARVAPKPVQPTQASFPGMGRKALEKAQRRTAIPSREDITQEEITPKPVTEEFLDDLGIPKTAPIRRRTVGKDFNQPEIRQDFASFAGLKSTSQTAKSNINRELTQAPAEQADLLSPAGRRRAAPAAPAAPTQPTEGGQDVITPTRPAEPPTGRASVPTGRQGVAARAPAPVARAATEGATAPEQGGLARTERGPARTAVRKGSESRTLKQKPKPKLKKVEKPSDTVPLVPERSTPARKQVTTQQPTPTQAREVEEKPVDRKETIKKVAEQQEITGPRRVKGRAPEALKRDAEQSKEIKERWDRRASDKVKTYVKSFAQTFGAPNTKDPSTAGDKTTILELLGTGRNNLDEKGKAARIYFEKYPRVADSMMMIVHDKAFNTPDYRKAEGEGDIEAAFLKGTGAKNAGLAIKWMEANLSPETNAWMKETLKEYGISVHGQRNYSMVDQVEKRRKLEAEEAEFVEEYTKANDIEEQAKIFKKYLDKDAVLALDTPMHPVVKAMLQQGDLPAALRALAATTPSKDVARVANRLAKEVGSTKVKVESTLLDESGKPVAGSFNPETNEIKLDAEIGMNPHVLLHEMTHAVTSATLANKSHPVTKQLTKLFNEAKEQLGSAYGSQSVDEFVAEGFSNPQFQQELATLFPAKQDVPIWKQFMNTVMNFVRRMVGAPSKGVDAQMSDLDQIIQSIIAPAPETRFAGELYMLSREGKMGQLLNSLGKTYYDGGRAQSEKKLVSFLDTVSEFFSRGSKVTKQLGLFSMPSQAMADIMKHMGISRGIELHRLFEEQEGAMGRIDSLLDGTIKKVTDWQKGKSQDVIDAFNNLVHNSTIYQVDPTKDRSEYSDNPEKLRYYDAMQADVKLAGKDGMQEYARLRDAYKDLYDRLRKVLDKRIDEMVEDKAARKKLRDEVYDKLFDQTRIEPYFPLTRQGDYWLSYNVGAEPVYEAFESDAARKRAIRELEAEAASGADVTEITPYTNVEQINFGKAPPTSFVGEVLKQLKSAGVDPEVSNRIVRLFIETLPESSFAKSMQNRKNRLGFQNDAVRAFRLKAYDLGRQAERIRYSEQMRTTLKEIDEEATARVKMSEALLSKQRAAELSGDQTRIDAVNEEIAQFEKDNGGLLSGENKNIMMDELNSRVEFATNPPADLLAQATRAANRVAFLGTIGFNVSSAIVNLSQLPLVVVPFMAGKTSMASAASALKTAAYFYGGSGLKHKLPVYGRENETTEINGVPSIDNYYVADKNGQLRLRDDIPDIDSTEVYYTMNTQGGKTRDFTKRQFLELMMPLVQRSSDRGLLNRSLFYDTVGAEMSGKAKNWRDRISAYSALPFHTAERFNRQIALSANYLNEIERLMTKPNKAKGEDKLGESEIFDRAIEEALYDTQQTNGGAVLATAPRIAQRHIGRVAMMYKTFGVQMYYTQMKTALEALKSADPYVRKQAMRQIVGVQLSALALSGVQGLTLFGIGAGIANLFLSDDEDDAETIARKYLGEGMYKGGVNALTGMLGAEIDVASRIGLSNLILGSNRYNFDPSMEKTIVQYLGGPFYGYGSQVLRGFGDIADGEIQRGVENVLPSAFRNMAKTYRFVEEGGIRTRRGDPIFDDLNAGLLAAQFMGFAPAEYTRSQEINQGIKRIDRSVSESRTKLLREYYIARRFGYSTADVMKEMQKFNRRHPSARITPETIDRSMKQHRKTTQKMYNGITLSPNMRDTLLQSASEYDRGPEFLR
jgi:hypothetical protein